MAGEIIKGVAGGAATGASIGAMFGGVGAPIGAVLGAAYGGFQGQRANKLQTAADKAQAAVNPVDPNQVAILDRMRRQEQAFRAGTDPSSAFAMRDIGARTAQTQRNIVQAGGPGVVGNLLRSQAIGNQGSAGVGAQAGTLGNQIMGLSLELRNLISKRVYDYQQRNRDMAMARAEQATQDVKNLLAGGIGVATAMAGAGDGKGFGGGTPKTKTPGNPADLYSKQTLPVAQPAATAQSPAWWSGSQPPAWWTPPR